MKELIESQAVWHEDTAEWHIVSDGFITIIISSIKTMHGHFFPVVEVFIFYELNTLFIRNMIFLFLIGWLQKF